MGSVPWTEGKNGTNEINRDRPDMSSSVPWAYREVAKARSREKAATKEETARLRNRLDRNCEKKEESK